MDYTEIRNFTLGKQSDAGTINSNYSNTHYLRKFDKYNKLDKKEQNIELVINGGAEAGMNGWTARDWVISNSKDARHSGNNGFGYSVPKGAAGGTASMSQTLPLQVGCTYSFSIWKTDARANGLYVLVSGILILESHSVGPYAWYSTAFTANSNSPIMEIRGQSEPGYALFIDDISVTLQSCPPIPKSFAPSPSPTFTPTLLPSSMPYPDYIIRYVNNGGIYNGTANSENWIINALSDSKITSNGGMDKFTIWVHSEVKTIITDFNPINQVVDLSSFNSFSKINDLDISSSPATLFLPENQQIIFQGLLPSSLTEVNFIFNQQSTAQNHKDNSNTPFYEQELFIGVAAVLGLITSLATIAGLCTKCTRHNPIGISLKQNSEIELVNFKESTVKFNYYNNDNYLKTSWVGSNDAILVYDHNSNINVDKAAEIVLTQWCPKANTDFEALLCNFDTNKDKIFNKQDLEFMNFYIWQDKNQDGISQDDELTSLEQAGIIAIDFNTQEEIQGELRELGALNKAEIMWSDGRITYAYDLVFTHD